MVDTFQLAGRPSVVDEARALCGTTAILICVDLCLSAAILPSLGPAAVQRSGGSIPWPSRHWVRFLNPARPETKIPKNRPIDPAPQTPIGFVFSIHRCEKNKILKNRRIDPVPPTTLRLGLFSYTATPPFHPAPHLPNPLWVRFLSAENPLRNTNAPSRESFSLRILINAVAIQVLLPIPPSGRCRDAGNHLLRPPGTHYFGY